jgi:hypothetical protein
LTFFSGEVWFHLQGYINTQNNHYRNSQNPHRNHEALLHPVKVGVWCAVSARRIVGPVFFNETINCERYVQVILWQFIPELTVEEKLYGWFQQGSTTAHTAHMSSGTELSAVVFGQHLHLILVLVIFSSGVV